MRIYSLHSANGFAYLHAQDEIVNQCVAEPPRSLANGWSTLTFELVGTDELLSYRPKSDFPALTLGTAVVSRHAVEELSPVLQSCGELLPIRLSNDRDAFYLFNVTYTLNAVDLTRSKFWRFPDGNIGHCEQLVFDPSLVPNDALFFKTNRLPEVYDIFATQTAVDAVKGARLTGYEFRLAWSNEPANRATRPT